MCMTPLALYELVCSWLSLSYLRKESLRYDERIYREALAEFWYDYIRWYPSDVQIEERKLILTPQLHPVLTYRLARLYFLCREENAASVCSLLGRIHGLTEIYYSAQIGRRLKINHGIGSVIGARCIVGDNCLLHHGVTLGDKDGGRPVIGNNVIIYAGAAVLGNITIGDNTVIGANAVCLRSTPPHAICVGSPAKNIADDE